jgi:hypothetical protein
MPNFVIAPNVGITRGNYAVDMNYLKTLGDQVASGYGSTLVAGANIKAEGSFATILGGYENTSFGDYGIVLNTANESTGDSCFVFGENNKVYASKSYVGGRYNVVKGAYNFVYGEYGNFPNELSTGVTVLGTQTFTIGTDSIDGDAQAPNTAILGGIFAWPVHEGEVVRNSVITEYAGLLKQAQHSVVTMFYEGAATTTSFVNLQTNGNMGNLPHLGRELTMLHMRNPITGKAAPMSWNLCVTWTAIDLNNNLVVAGEDVISVNRNNVSSPIPSIASVLPSSPTTGKVGDGSLLSSQMSYVLSPLYSNSISIRFKPSYNSTRFRVVARVSILQSMYYPV